jgi:hypothetical protein
MLNSMVIFTGCGLEFTHCRGLCRARAGVVVLNMLVLQSQLLTVIDIH